MVSDSSFNDFLTGALSAPPRTFLAFSNAELDRVNDKTDIQRQNPKKEAFGVKLKTTVHTQMTNDPARKKTNLHLTVEKEPN